MRKMMNHLFFECQVMVVLLVLVLDLDLDLDLVFVLDPQVVQVLQREANQKS